MLATMDAAPVSKVVSPEELDTIIREAYVLGNDVRRKLIMALAAMDEGRFYLALGFSGVWGQRLTLDAPRTTQEQPRSSDGVSSVKR